MALGYALIAQVNEEIMDMIESLSSISIATLTLYQIRGSWGCDRMIVKFTTTHAINAITTIAVSLNPTHGEVYSIPHYVIKFVSDLLGASGSYSFDV